MNCAAFHHTWTTYGPQAVTAKFGTNLDWVMNLHHNIEIEAKGNSCPYVDNKTVRSSKVWPYSVNYDTI